MSALNACFLFGLLLVGYALFAGLLFLATSAFRVTRERRVILVSIPIYLLLVGAYIAYSVRPTAQFERAFGFAPPPDVIELRSSQWILGDSGVIYLAFRASPQTIARIKARGFSAAPGTPPPGVTGDPPPAWWAPPEENVATYLHRTEGGSSFAMEEEWLSHNPSTGQVFFRFIGID